MPMKIVTVHLPELYIKALDEIIKKKEFPNRAEAIRYAVRDFIFKELGEIPQNEDGKD